MSLPRQTAGTLAIVREVKRALRIRSDYAVSQVLKVTRSAVSKWRTGKCGMSDDVALRAAELTGREPMYYFMRVWLERTNDPKVRAVWASRLETLERTGELEVRS